ncbi:hypothetical protein LJC15_04315, partial [Desulfovibrio sp. OttesenSCG-928-G11]|nr:hypothetical protein [Desulfovibrio sp. OttesenSCG-928-G11]
MDTLTRQQQHFDSIAERYFDARKDPRHLALKEAIWTSFFPRLPLPGTKRCRVLEAMCGYA